jgi:pimeloyl-ACP methyl ester carboxylesterase
MNKRSIALSPLSASWGHHEALGTDGVQIHYVRQGKGMPVVLLHGWPGFWYDWRHVIPVLSRFSDVIAPDFRGFGDSDKPDVLPEEGYTPHSLARDIIALLDHLQLDSVVLVAHDIGATVAQTLAHLIPNRIESMILMNPPYPGIGSRRFEPQMQRASAQFAMVR